MAGHTSLLLILCICFAGGTLLLTQCVCVIIIIIYIIQVFDYIMQSGVYVCFLWKMPYCGSAVHSFFTT